MAYLSVAAYTADWDSRKGLKKREAVCWSVSLSPGLSGLFGLFGLSGLSGHYEIDGIDQRDWIDQIDEQRAL